MTYEQCPLLPLRLAAWPPFAFHSVRVQYGSCIAGTELLRKVEGEEGEEKELCFGLTFPLLTKADGRKFGKSEGGAVWLTAGETPFCILCFAELCNSPSCREVLVTWEVQLLLE